MNCILSKLTKHSMQAKMKAEQSKFLSSMNSATDDVSNTGAEGIDSDGTQNLEESTQDVCSLCHDPNSKNPVSFLVLLQVSYCFVGQLL